MEFERDSDALSPLVFCVPDQAMFDRLVDLTELPESTLEVAETRQLVDEFLDTTTLDLSTAGSALRLATVGEHHFLIYQRRFGKRLLTTGREFVERLTAGQYTAALAGDRLHPLFTTVAIDVPGTLANQLTRRSVFQSKLFRVGETRFELSFEAVGYEANGRLATDQLASLQLIEGNPDILAAIGELLKTEYNLTLLTDSPFNRGLSLLST